MKLKTLPVLSFCLKCRHLSILLEECSIKPWRMFVDRTAGGSLAIQLRCPPLLLHCCCCWVTALDWEWGRALLEQTYCFALFFVCLVCFHSPCWPETHYRLVSNSLRSAISASWVLELKACATMPNWLQNSWSSCFSLLPMLAKGRSWISDFEDKLWSQISFFPLRTRHEFRTSH